MKPQTMVKPHVRHIKLKSTTRAIEQLPWPLCFWAAQSMAAKMKYDLGFNKPVDLPLHNPGDDTQDLGEGVEDTVSDNIMEEGGDSTVDSSEPTTVDSSSSSTVDTSSDPATSVESQHIPPSLPNFAFGRSRSKVLEELEIEIEKERAEIEKERAEIEKERAELERLYAQCFLSG